MDHEPSHEEKEELFYSFFNRLAVTETSKMTEAERSLDLVYWYRLEVLNGGHLQYFHNQTVRGEEPYEACIIGLEGLGCGDVAGVLRCAVAIWHSKRRTAPWTLDEFSSEAMAGEFSKLDFEFYDLDAQLQTRLEAAVLDLTKPT